MTEENFVRFVEIYVLILSVSKPQRLNNLVFGTWNLFMREKLAEHSWETTSLNINEKLKAN